MKYCVCITSPPDYPHSATFQEVALGLQGGFSELGISVPILRWPDQRHPPNTTPIFLGANILPVFPRLQTLLPDNAILYNLEQFTESSEWMREEYLRLLRSYEVWDYSRENIAALTLHGVRNAKFCGIGYAQALEQIVPTTEDIDVLFYGSVFGRRAPILDAIEASGLRVQKLFGCYGAERDAWIARSKVVLNLHAYDRTIFEIVRCSYLWANRKCIVSEPSTEVPPGMEDGMLVGTDTSLPLLCHRATTDVRLRASVATRGYEKFKDIRQSSFLKNLINRRQ